MTRGWSRYNSWFVPLPTSARRGDPETLCAIPSQLARLLESGQAQGVIRGDIAADILADQISAIGDGWGMMFPVEPERFDRGRIHALVNAAIVMLTPQAS